MTTELLERLRGLTERTRRLTLEAEERRRAKKPPAIPREPIAPVVEPEGYIWDYEISEFVPATREQVAERERLYAQYPEIAPPGTPAKITPTEYEERRLAGVAERERVFAPVFPQEDIDAMLRQMVITPDMPEMERLTAEQAQEDFLDTIWTQGRTPETEAILRQVGFAEEQIVEFFPPEVAPVIEVPGIARLTPTALQSLTKAVFPEYEVNLDELLRWGAQYPEAFKQKIKDAGPTKYSEALLKAVSPPPLTEPWYIFGQPGASFTAGVGDVSSTTGGFLEWLGAPEETVKQFKEFGEFLQSAYIPPADPKDFSWRSTLDPEWWATSVTRSVPFFLSLLPSAILAAHGGVAVAGVIGLGKFGTLVLGSLAAAGASRPIESAFEAGSVYNEMIARGLSEEEADRAASETFWGNMKLAGWDATQFVMAFFPIKGGGSAIRQILNKRIVAAGIKVTGVGIMEAGEEAYQEVVQRRAMGEPTALDPEMKEAMAIGFIFGAGLGGAGSVFETLTNRVKKDMTPDMLADIDRTIKAELARGATPEQAQLTALDRIAETPEGSRSIERTIEDLKSKAREVEPTEPVDPPVLMQIPDSEKILDTIMTDNWMRTLLQKVAKVPPARKLIELGLGTRILISRPSEEVEDIIGRGRFLHTEISRRAEGSEALIYWRLFELESNPVKLFGFSKQAVSPETKIKRLTEEADGTIEDIFTHPEQYALSEKQMRYVTRVHKINTQILNMLKAEGVAPENVGDSWWMHRVVLGKYDPNGELTRVRGRPGTKRGRIGAKVSFEMHRKAPTMADGIAWGILYGRDPAEAVSTYASEAFKKIADARFEKYIAKELEPLAKMGVLPTEELLRKYPEVVERAIITAEELADTNSFVDKINRAIRGEKLTEQTLRAIERRFPAQGRKLRALVVEPAVEVPIRDYVIGVSKALPTIKEMSAIFEQVSLEDRLAYRVKAEGMVRETGDRGAKRILKALDNVDTQPEFIPVTEPGMVPVPEATLSLDEISKYETRIPLDLIRKDEPKTLRRLTEEIKEKGITEPITIRVREDGSRIVWDGIHRLIVAQDLGIKNVPVRFIGAVVEPRIQQDIFGYETPMFPKGKGIVTQISMDDYARLAELHEKEGLPPPNVVIKPKIEGVKGMEAETQIAEITYEVPAIKSVKERKASLETLRKEVKALAEARRLPFWEARTERAYRMQQIRQPGIDEGYIMHPFAGGRIFDQDFIDAFNKFFGHDAGLAVLKPTADTAGILRILKAALDFSQPMIQGTLSWGLAHSYLLGNPKVGVKLMGAWYKTFFEQIGAFFNPGIAARFMEANQEAISRRIAAGGSARAVFFFQEMQAVVGKGKIARMAETVLRHIPLTPYQRAEVSFFAGGEIVRDRFWEVFEEEARAKGEDGELARFLDILTGIADPRAMGVPLTVRQMEQSFIFFSSAYTRSYLTLVAEIFRGGMTGAKARRSLAGFIVAGAAYYTGIQYAISTLMGKDDDEAWEDVQRGFGLHQDPITGDWEWRPTAAMMSLKIGDNYFGIGGGIYGLMRLAGNIAATVQEIGEREKIDLVRIMKHGSLNKRDNPFISWWYARSSALFSPIYEMITKQDFLGYPIETPEEYARYIISLFEPIWVEQSINPLIPGMAGDREVPEDALETVAWITGELFGLRVNPEYSWQRFYNKANEYIPHIPEEQLDALQREAIAQGRKLDWGSLTKIQKINLLYRYPELREIYEEAQADSELRAQPHWKAWEGRQEEERTTYYERGNSLIERVVTGELDTRELREMWGEAGQNYGVALDMLEKEPAYQEIYDFFDRQREKGDRYLFEADIALAEYIDIIFAEYVDEKGDIDWDAKDRAIDSYVEKWGEEWYGIIREMYAKKRLLDDLNPALVRLSDDKDKLGREYWRLPYKPIKEMDEEDEVKGNIPAEYYSLWRQYQALPDVEREAFLELHPELAKDWREEYRQANPENDARLALWGYGGKLQSMEAYDFVIKWAKELGIPLEQVGLGLPPRSLIDDYFELNRIVSETGGSSVEAKLFKLEHPEYLAWGLEQEIWKDNLEDENIEALRLRVKNRDSFAEYGAIEDPDERELYLNLHKEFRDDRRRIDAYALEFPDTKIESYVEYYALPVKGFRQERYLLEHPEFADAMHTIKGIDLPKAKDVPPVQYDEIYERYQSDFRKLEGLSDHTSEHYIEDPDERSKVRDRMLLDERGKFTKFGVADRKLDAYKINFPENLIDTYVDWYETRRSGYEDDWFLMEHKDFYNVMVSRGILQLRDFSKVPSRAIAQLYAIYQGLPSGKVRLDYRAQNPELEWWLVNIKGYTPIGERGDEGADISREEKLARDIAEGFERLRKLRE